MSMSNVHLGNFHDNLEQCTFNEKDNTMPNRNFKIISKGEILNILTYVILFLYDNHWKVKAFRVREFHVYFCKGIAKWLLLE